MKGEQREKREREREREHLNLLYMYLVQSVVRSGTMKIVNVFLKKNKSIFNDSMKYTM